MVKETWRKVYVCVYVYYKVQLSIIDTMSIIPAHSHCSFCQPISFSLESAVKTYITSQLTFRSLTTVLKNLTLSVFIQITSENVLGGVHDSSREVQEKCSHRRRETLDQRKAKSTLTGYCKEQVNCSLRAFTFIR